MPFSNLTFIHDTKHDNIQSRGLYKVFINVFNLNNKVYNVYKGN